MQNGIGDLTSKEAGTAADDAEFAEEQEAEAKAAMLAKGVTAGDAERRKLERNLHDGAQQHLVAMAVKLRIAEDLIDEQPGDALDVIVILGVLAATDTGAWRPHLT